MTHEEQQYAHNVQCAFTLLKHDAELTSDALNVNPEFVHDAVDTVTNVFNGCEGKRSHFYEQMIVALKPKSIYELFILGTICGNAEGHAQHKMKEKIKGFEDFLRGLKGDSDD
jgi:hypothetical protein